MREVYDAARPAGLKSGPRFKAANWFAFMGHERGICVVAPVLFWRRATCSAPAGRAMRSAPSVQSLQAPVRVLMG